MRFGKQREEAKTTKDRKTMFERAMKHFRKFNYCVKMYKISISDEARLWNVFQVGSREKVEFDYREARYNDSSNVIMQQ